MFNLFSFSKNFQLKNQLKQISSVVFSEIFIKIISFVTLPIILKSIGSDKFGLVTSIEAILMTIGPILTFNIESYLTRFYHIWNNKILKYRVGFLFFFNLLLVSFFFITTLIIINYFFDLFKLENYLTKKELFLELIAILFYTLSIFLFSLIRITEKIKLFSVIRILKFILLQLLLLYFFYNKDSKPWKYFLANLITEGFTYFVLLCYTFKMFKFYFSKKIIVKVIKFSFPLVPNSILSSLIFTIDKFVFLTFTNFEIVGLYMLSLKFSGLVSQMHSILKISYGPFLYKTLAADIKNKYLELSKTAILYIVPILITSILINLFFFDYFIFTLNVNYKILFFIPIVIISEFFLDLYVYITPGIILSNKTHLSIIPSIFQIVSFVIIVLLSFRYFGFYSVLISKLFSSIMFFLLNFYYTKKHYPSWIMQVKKLKIFFFFLFLSGLIGFLRQYFEYKIGLLLCMILVLIPFILFLFFDLKKSFKLQ